MTKPKPPTPHTLGPLVFIDESGDTGFKTGSSRFFTICMVVFDDMGKGGRSPHAEEASQTIQGLCRKFHINPEYHFSNTSNPNRERFFEGIKGCSFAVYGVVVDKQKLTRKSLRENPKAFYNAMLKELLARHPIRHAKIKLDGERSKKLGRVMQAFIRQECPDAAKDFDFLPSHRNSLIQLADMVCGGIHYEHNRAGELNAGRWRKMLGRKIRNIWMYGEE